MTTTADAPAEPATNGTGPAPADEFPPIPGSTPRLNAALAAAQAEMPPITKGETGKISGTDKYGNPFSYNYSYADLAALASVAYPITGKHGLAFSSQPTLVDGKFVLQYQLLHKSGESIGGIMILPSTGKVQELGSLLTYYKRYAFCAVTGITPGGEDDDVQSSNHEQRFDRYGDNDRGSGGRPGSAGESFENARPASPRNGQQRQRPDRPAADEPSAPPVPPPLDDDDDWKVPIDDCTDADTAQKLRDDVTGARIAGSIDQARHDQLMHAITVQGEKVRAANRAPQASANPAQEIATSPPTRPETGDRPGAEPAGDEQKQLPRKERDFMENFYKALDAAKDEREANSLIGSLLGPAIRNRIISGETLKELQHMVAMRREELTDAAKATSQNSTTA
jgi:hypothetical protein